MNQHTPTIEWQVAENDADWERLCTPPLPDIALEAVSPVYGRLDMKRYLGRVAVILLVLTSAGAWGRRATQAGLQPAVQHIEPASPLGITSYTVDVQGDQNVTRVVLYTDDGTPAYRQTRFYRRTASGWQPTAPDAALWGPERSLATPYFVYHFRQNDATAVNAVAPQMDALYATMRRNVGLPIASIQEKLVVAVSITRPPGYASPWFGAPERLRVPSPAVYWAPVELTDTELLAQSIVLPLLEHVVAQASERYVIGEDWQPLLDGMRLWQLWDLDLPLSVWREDVVKWIYLDLPTTRSGEAIVLAERYTAFCTAHKLWMPSPLLIDIPLVCADLVWEDGYWLPWSAYDSPIRLSQLAAPMPLAESIEQLAQASYASHPGQTVALATLIEYAVTTYGRELLPELVAGLGQYESWETLLPAVFGVSTSEFEAGWQAYLAARYGVP
jgi:hypothetical protein